MNEVQIVSIVSLVGFLVLMLASYRAHQVSAGKTLRMALIWGCIFLAIAFVFSLIS